MDLDVGVTRERLKRAGLVAVLTLGLTSLAAVLTAPGPDATAPSLVAAIAVLGWFVVAPLVATVGRSSADADEAEGSTASTPLETLRERYAAGEISEAEFERKAERLLETDPDGAGHSDPDGAGHPAPDLTDTVRTTEQADETDRDLERELE